MVARTAISRSLLFGWPLGALTFAFLFAASPVPVLASDYVVTLLGSGYSSSLANGINGGRIAMIGNSSSFEHGRRLDHQFFFKRAAAGRRRHWSWRRRLAIDGNTVAGQVILHFRRLLPRLHLEPEQRHVPRPEPQRLRPVGSQRHFQRRVRRRRDHRRHVASPILADGTVDADEPHAVDRLRFDRIGDQ